MTFDKPKVLRSAERYLSQGKFQGAIKEYSQVAEHDPHDFTVLNMLGDLYVRTGKKKEAIGCFVRIAEHFRDQGFALKAIAMYKKIDRLAPGTPEIANKLAVLYEGQGLIVDARTQYLTVIDAFIKAGESQKALEVLRKVADLDPHNVDLRLRLAEGYLHERVHPQAASAYLEAGEQLLARHDYERALDAYTRSLRINPGDHAAIGGLVSTHIKRGTPEEAADFLEDMVVKRPEDVDLLSMLANTYVQAGDAVAAERVTTALVEQQAVNYICFVDVARLYLKQGDIEPAVRILATITEQMLSGREENDLLALVNEVLGRDPEHVKGLRLLVRIHWWQRDVDKLRGALERLAEAAEAANLVEDQRSALTQLVQLVPDEPTYIERLRLIGGADQSFEPPPDSSQLFGEVPTFENFALAGDDVGVAEIPGHALDQTSESQIPPEASSPSTSATSFSDLNDLTDVTQMEPPSPSTGSPVAQSTEGFQEFEFSSTPAETPPVPDQPDAGSVPAAQDPRYEAAWRQELESVDFYIAQGYTDIAKDTLDMLERQFGPNEQIDLRRSQLTDGASQAAHSDAAEPINVPDESLDLVQYDIGGDSPLSENVGGEVDDAFSQLDLGSSKNGMASPVQKDTPPPPVAQPGLDPGLAAIFEEFRAAAEEEEPAPEGNDFETHYNLGLAYKDMDLLDEAIEEFQFASGMVGPADGTPRYLQCCNLLGHCFLQKQMPRAAVMWFSKGLKAPGHTQDEYQALRYDLGNAYEQMGELDNAIDVFTEVYGVNVSYRGVAEKLRSLQAQKSVKAES